MHQIDLWWVGHQEGCFLGCVDAGFFCLSEISKFACFSVKMEEKLCFSRKSASNFTILVEKSKRIGIFEGKMEEKWSFWRKHGRKAPSWSFFRKDRREMAFLKEKWKIFPYLVILKGRMGGEMAFLKEKWKKGIHLGIVKGKWEKNGLFEAKRG